MSTKDGAALKVVAGSAPRDKHATIAVPNGRVTGGYVLKQLVADGLLATSDAERFKTSGGRDRAGHPLANLAEMNYRTPNAERKLLDLEMLTHWLASKANLPYYHIDPLRVDFTRVAEVMSSSYATTYSILPLAVSGDEVTITTCEPFQTGWDTRDRADHEKVGQESRVATRTTLRATRRSSTSSRSRSAARQRRARRRWCRASSSWSSSAARFEANDAHVIHIVDWLLQYAFDQRASDIHLEPRREFGVARFRIDGVLHQVYQVPAGVMARDDEPNQAARSHGRGREAPAAGWPHQDESRDRPECGPRSRNSPVDTADGIRRKARDADLRSRGRRAQLCRTRFHAGGSAQLGRTDPPAVTASCWSPVPPARARPRRCIRR